MVLLYEDNLSLVRELWENVAVTIWRENINAMLINLSPLAIYKYVFKILNFDMQV
jgi:hypothetical protein